MSRGAHRAASPRWVRQVTILAAGLLLAGTGVAMAATPTTEETRSFADQSLAYCQTLRVAARTSAQRTRANNCITDAQTVQSALASPPAPSPSATSSPTVSPAPSPMTPPPTTLPPGPTSSPTLSPTPLPSLPVPPLDGCPAFPAFPDSSCTGWQHTGVALHLCSVPFGQVETDGAVFDSCYFSGGLVINATNVTITRSMIHGPVTAYWASNYTLRGLVMTDVEIEQCALTTVTGPLGCSIHNPTASSDTAAIAGGDFTCTRCDIHNNVTGVHLGNNAVLVDSYIHDLDYFDGSHGAAAGMGLGTGLHSRIIHNNLDCARLAGQPGICSAALSVYDEPDPHIDDVLVEHNLLNTIIGYCTYAGGPAGTHIVYRDNRFGMRYNPDCGSHGPVAAFDPTDPGNVWTGNLFTDGRPVTV